MKDRSAPRKISEKKLKALGGRVPFSTITAKPKPIKKVNVERAAKRNASYRKKLAAYRKSETYKVVQQRAACRCEFEITYQLGPGASVPVRCPIEEGLHHHHKRYGRQFGGNERPEDIQVLCKQHHAFVESQHPTRRHGR